jgi:positive regulator of sigma E activity
MGTMASKLDKSAVLILLIPTVLVVVGLVLALLTRDVRVIGAMLAITGALLMGFAQARRSRRDASRGGS